MRRIVLLTVLMLTVRCALAQTYGRMDFSLQNAQGQALSGATVNVYTQASCGTAAGALATLYSTATGTVILQPLYTDGYGHAYAYTLPGCVTVVYNSAYTGTLTYPDQSVWINYPALPTNNPTFTGTLTGPTANITAISGALTGNASTATALAATPAQCSSGNYSTGITAAGVANCAQVNYTQLASGAATPTTETQTACATAASISTPCVVYEGPVLSESSPTGTPATVFTTSAAGFYRVTGSLYPTTASSTTYTCYQHVFATQVSQTGTNDTQINQATIGSSAAMGTTNLALYNLGAGSVIQTDSYCSGSNNGGAWKRWVVIERMY